MNHNIYLEPFSFRIKFWLIFFFGINKPTEEWQELKVYGKILYLPRDIVELKFAKEMSMKEEMDTMET